MSARALRAAMSARALRAAALTTVAGALLSGCVLPAWGEASYRGKAQTSAAAALSEVQTARLAAEQLLRSRLQQAYADEVISASETALGSIAESFGSVQPPRASDAVRKEVTALLDDAGSVVADARVAARRSDSGALTGAVDGLARLADELADLEERLA